MNRMTDAEIDEFRTPRDAAPAERWQHGTVAEVIEGRQQIARPVLALRKSGRIGDAEVEAAGRFYRDYALGMFGARDAMASGSGGGAQGFSAAMIDALTGYRAACQALGNYHTDLLRVVVVEECSLTAFAGRSARHRERAAQSVAEALKALADHYAKVDGARPGKHSPIRAIFVD